MIDEATAARFKKMLEAIAEMMGINFTGAVIFIDQLAEKGYYIFSADDIRRLVAAAIESEVDVVGLAEQVVQEG